MFLPLRTMVLSNFWHSLEILEQNPPLTCPMPCAFLPAGAISPLASPRLPGRLPLLHGPRHRHRLLPAPPPAAPRLLHRLPAAHAHVCMHTHTCAHARVYTCTRTHMHVHTCAHVHTHVHTHALTLPWRHPLPAVFVAWLAFSSSLVSF